MDNSPKHTPGPWSVSPDNGAHSGHHCSTVYIRLPNFKEAPGLSGLKEVCRVWGRPDPDVVRYDLQRMPGTEEFNANLLLIAASPEMLDVLRSTLDLIDEVYDKLPPMKMKDRVGRQQNNIEYVVHKALGI